MIETGKRGYANMLRSELVENLYEEFGRALSKRDVRSAVDTVFEEIIDTLAQDGRIELRGFGSFTTRITAARTGHNPRTGEAVAIPETHHVYFRAGSAIRDRINGRVSKG